MREILNEKPFEHHCRNGTVFKARRCDFKGGVTAYIPDRMPLELMMEDASELAAWHWANIVPKLNGFTGPAQFTILSRPDQKGWEKVLNMPIMEFFSLDSLHALNPSKLSTRTFNILEVEHSLIVEECGGDTMEAFLHACSICRLKSIPGFGASCINLLVSRLASEGFKLNYA